MGVNARELEKMIIALRNGNLSYPIKVCSTIGVTSFKANTK